MQFSAGQDVRLKHYGARTSFDGFQARAPRGIDISISTQLHILYEAYVVKQRRIGGMVLLN